MAIKSFKDIRRNRETYLAALRSGLYAKGTICSDVQGNPVFTNGNKEGYCACALMHDMFSTSAKPLGYRHALGLTAIQCRYIQQELNDTPLTFAEIADRIEAEIFA